MKNQLGPQDLSKLAQCACFNLRKTVRMVTQQYDRFLRESGMRATQLPLLAHAAQGGITMTQMAKKLGMDRTTLTRNLRPLEKKRWIIVSPGEDLRVREIQLTPRGQQVLAKAFPLWQQAQSWFIHSIGASQWHNLYDLMASAGAKKPR